MCPGTGVGKGMQPGIEEQPGMEKGKPWMVEGIQPGVEKCMLLEMVECMLFEMVEGMLPEVVEQMCLHENHLDVGLLSCQWH